MVIWLFELVRFCCCWNFRHFINSQWFHHCTKYNRFMCKYCAFWTLWMNSFYLFLFFYLHSYCRLAGPLYTDTNPSSLNLFKTEYRLFHCYRCDLYTLENKHRKNTIGWLQMNFIGDSDVMYLKVCMLYELMTSHIILQARILP